MLSSGVSGDAELLRPAGIKVEMQSDRSTGSIPALSRARRKQFPLARLAVGAQLLFHAGLFRGFEIDAFQHPGCYRRNVQVICPG